MLETLKSLYKDNLIEGLEEYDFDQYFVFLDENNQTFGILKEALTENERKLIEIKYSLVDQTVFKNSQYKLIEFLFGQIDEYESQVKSLQYFFIRTDNQMDKDLQNELMMLLIASFNEEAIITIQKNTYIIVVEENEEIDFSSLLESIEMDFMIPILGFESDVCRLDKDLPERFKFEFESLEHYKSDGEILITKAKVMRHHLFEQLPFENKLLIKSYILGKYANDKEMLKIIKVYFENNFNTTSAAKHTYMHRNTFLNKLDKFMEETKLNLRYYEDAFIAYLALNL